MEHPVLICNDDNRPDGMPWLRQKLLVLLDAGDRVWDWDTRQFSTVIGAGRDPQNSAIKLVVFHGGDAARYDTREITTVVVANNPDAADAWNAQHHGRAA